MWTIENRSELIPWFSVGYEKGSSVLYALQRSDGRLRKARECSIAVVEAAEYECSDQPFSDLLTSGTTYLAQSPQLEEAASNYTADVLLHGQLVVEVDAEITNFSDRLDDVITDRERQVSRR
jgi:hypothetical protein